MRRRDALRSGSGLLGASLAGCLASLESESAWRDLVVDRPDRVYVPPKVDGMTTWGTETAGEYAVSLFATRPHRFWTVTGRETTQIAMREDHSVHLMASVRNPETGRHVPAEVTVSIERGGESVLDRTLWPMLSQRMGVHRGDNVALPGDGVYTAVLRVLPEARRAPEATGAGFEPTTVEVEFEFEFEERTIDALGRTILDEDRRGRPGAVKPMDHAGHGRSGDDHGHAERGHPPVATAPPADSLPGIVAISEADDCRVVVALLPIDGEDGEYLAVSPRTPYNGFPWPARRSRRRSDGTGNRDAAVRGSRPGSRESLRAGRRSGRTRRGADDRVRLAATARPPRGLRDRVSRRSERHSVASSVAAVGPSRRSASRRTRNPAPSMSRLTTTQ
ncbi:hypothetical protein [Halalkalicoccus salilacus]|uniref:hypothetical protein n=1 Tax=Halalkalicoccus sp. GCM10025704 TaxID=3252662 RepID=UPI00360EB896